MKTDLTRLISAAHSGDADSRNELWERVYDEIHRMAQAKRRKRPSDTFQSTEIVHEVYRKIAHQLDIPCQDRRYFFGMVANAIEQILADHAKARRRKKRGGDAVRVELLDMAGSTKTSEYDAQTLQQAIAALAEEDSRCAEIMRLRCWASLTNAEVAKVLQTPLRTVERDWQFGKMWLARRLKLNEKL